MKLHDLKLLAVLFLFLPALMVTTGCDSDDDDEPENEQELITSVILTFTPTSGVPLVFSAKDLDGDGGNPPVVEDITLAANTSYTLAVAFLDESDPTDVENITEEVLEEDEEHLVCFTVSGSVPAPSIQDKDDDGNDLGLISTFMTGAAGSGTLRVTLKHEAEKGTPNACSTGETDADQTFNVSIQ